jgi:hypothetical protein
MTRLLALLLLSTAAQADTVSTWNGTGENPCAGACTQAWFEAQLPDHIAALWQDARAADWSPERIDVQRGDMLAFMSFASDGAPYIDSKTLVADPVFPEVAYGWWIGPHTAVVQIVGCSNWVVLIRDPRAGAPSGAAVTSPGVLAYLLPPSPPVTASASAWSAAGAWAWSWSSSSTTVNVNGPGCGCVPVDPEPPVAPIPLPAAGLLMLAGDRKSVV